MKQLKSHVCRRLPTLGNPACKGSFGLALAILCQRFSRPRARRAGSSGRAPNINVETGVVVCDQASTFARGHRRRYSCIDVQLNMTLGDGGARGSPRYRRPVLLLKT